MRTITPVFLLLILSLLSGCKRDVIVYYEIPKEAVKQDVMQLPDGHPDVAGSSVQGSATSSSEMDIIWVKPEGWNQGVTSSMRLGSYLLPEVPKNELDISITRFPGDVGGLFSNVNRWRGQLGLQRILNPEDLTEMVSDFQTDAFSFKWVFLKNENAPSKSMIVAVLDLNGSTWFIKMSGLSIHVEAENERFREFVKSVKTREGNE